MLTQQHPESTAADHNLTSGRNTCYETQSLSGLAATSCTIFHDITIA